MGDYIENEIENDLPGQAQVYDEVPPYPDEPAGASESETTVEINEDDPIILYQARPADRRAEAFLTEWLRRLGH